MTALTASVCAGLAVALVWLTPPTPARVRELEPTTTGADADPAKRVQQGLARLGRTVRTLLLRRPPAHPAADRRLGTGALVAVLALTVDPVLAGVATAVAWVLLRWIRLRRRRDGDRRRPVEADLPELVDLVALAVAAGLALPDALGAAAPCTPPSLRDDVTDAVSAIAAGARVEAALLQLGRRWGEPGRPFVHALVDHTRYGTPLVPSLERVGAEARTRRRRAAETRARRLPVLLLFPLVLCTLPAFGMLTVAPLVAGTLGSLEGSPLEAPASTAP